MERKEYFEICQKCAVIKNKDEIPEDLLVVWHNGKYYPIAYKVSFDDKGNAIHEALLHDRFANSVLYADMLMVERYREENSND